MLSWIINNRIAIDLDEVLASTVDIALAYHKKKGYLKHLNFDDLIEHDWRKIPSVVATKEELVQIWNELLSSDLIDEIIPVEQSMEWINKLKQKWLELHIITARPDYLKERTNYWINKNFQDQFVEIHFANIMTNKPTPKSEICKKLWINTIIEDNIDYSLELANNWITVILLEKPWNKHRSEVHSNIIKVQNWWDIIKNF